MAVSVETMKERTKNIRPLHMLEGHTAPVLDIVFSPDSKLLASGGNDKAVNIWDVQEGKLLRTLGQHKTWVSNMSFSRDGKMLASSAPHDNMYFWDVENPGLLRVLAENGPDVFWGSFSPGGDLFASGGKDKKVSLWDSQDGDSLNALEGHDMAVKFVTFSRTGHLLVSADDQNIFLWDSKTGKKLRTLATEPKGLNHISLSPDEKWLAACYEHSLSFEPLSTLVICDVETGEKKFSDMCPANIVHKGTWSPDSSVLITRSRNAADGIRFYHVDTMEIFHTLPQDDKQLDRNRTTRALEISPCGRLLATYAADSLQNIQIWDISCLEIGPKE